MELNQLIEKVSNGVDLTIAESSSAADALASPDVSTDEKKRFLIELSRKGEASDEVAGLANRFRELARDPGLERWKESAIDVCGTGGDKQGTFNISTTVTFILSAAGIPVFKHGNKSITSKCGSANLLEALGVNITAENEILGKSMEELGFCFMFAQSFHPAFKEIMPVRKALAEEGRHSVFNLLGPLINPGVPAYQLIGVYSPKVMGLVADALTKMGLKAGFIAHCDLGPEGGMDEFSVAGLNLMRGVGALSDADDQWMAEDFGLHSGSLSELQGGDVEENLKIFDQLLAGHAPKALEDSVVLNASAALRVLGRHSSIKDGIEESRDLLLGGAVRSKIDQTREFYSSL